VVGIDNGCHNSYMLGMIRRRLGPHPHAGGVRTPSLEGCPDIFELETGDFQTWIMAPLLPLGISAHCTTAMDHGSSRRCLRPVRPRWRPCTIRSHGYRRAVQRPRMRRRSPRLRPWLEKNLGRYDAVVVHGLWPQYETGFPQTCGPASTVPASIVDSMLPLMPSPQLIQHEWQTHGTCSGLDVTSYFQLIQKAFATVAIPDDYKSPLQQIQVAPADVKAKFAQANPSFPAGAFTVQCSGQYLSEVRPCLTKDLQGRACGADARDSCSRGTVILRPVR